MKEVFHLVTVFKIDMPSNNDVERNIAKFEEFSLTAVEVQKYVCSAHLLRHYRDLIVKTESTHNYMHVISCELAGTSCKCA